MLLRDLWSRGWFRQSAFWAAVLLAYVLIGIDDWGRDWIEYRAEAAFEPDDARVAALLEAPPGHPGYVSPQEWATAVRWAARRIANLRYQGEATDGDTIVLQFVRTHRLLRLRDDVQVRIGKDGRKRTIDARSEARLHVGDLGRNPGTLRRLYAELEDVVAESNLNPQIGVPVRGVSNR